jgi:hypothetical protein
VDLGCDFGVSMGVAGEVEECARYGCGSCVTTLEDKHISVSL